MPGAGRAEAPVRVGVLLPTREAVLSGRSESGPLLEMAERAEAAGYDSLWAGDSLLARPRFEPLTLLAAAAARTRRVTLGTAVLLPALRHPLLLAHTAASLDRIAEGRLVLGVGVATDSPPTRREFEAVGVPFAQRVGRMVESLAICRRLWSARSSADRVTFEGKYWVLDRAQLLPSPSRTGGPPIWMGGGSEAACRRAGQMADGWFPNSPTPEAFRRGWARVLDAARQAKRPASAVMPALYATVRLDDDPDTARKEMARFVETYYGLPYDVIAARQGCYAGPAAGCREWLAGFIAAGARHVVLRFAGPDQKDQLERASTGLLASLRAG
ncbi:MAG TPA: LLM class flavin-dependent oxidoreductase [Methylomirabilota bacterium]|nr:LLM class flavin-dependent oxidoreductase [Methylomirabilota bacterium]